MSLIRDILSLPKIAWHCAYDMTDPDYLTRFGRIVFATFATPFLLLIAIFTKRR